MAHLTYERAQDIFANRSSTHYQVQEPHFLEIDVDSTNAHGSLTGISTGIEITSAKPDTPTGIIAAQRVASTWGRTSLHINRTDESNHAYGSKYVVFSQIPNFKEEFLRVSRSQGPIKYGFLPQSD